MNENEKETYVKCKACGTRINVETGEQHFSEGAVDIKELKKKLDTFEKEKAEKDKKNKDYGEW